MRADQDFYEDDEPLEKLLAAFDGGEQGVTAPLTRGRTEFVRLDFASPAGVQSELVGNARRSA